LNFLSTIALGLATTQEILKREHNPKNKMKLSLLSQQPFMNGHICLNLKSQ